MTDVKPIEYLDDISLLRNFNRLKKVTGLNTKNFAYAANTSEASVNKYIHNRFRTNSGGVSDIGNRLKAVVSRLFIGGIPDSALHKEKRETDLFALFGCASCRYRMRYHQGCFKFSPTKTEINNGAWVETIDGSAFNFSKKNRCSHAK